MGLPWAMIGVLAYDHEFNFIQRGGIKGPEYIRAAGIDGLALFPFSFKVRYNMMKISLTEFLPKCLFP